LGKNNTAGNEGPQLKFDSTRKLIGGRKSQGIRYPGGTKHHHKNGGAANSISTVEMQRAERGEMHQGIRLRHVTNPGRPRKRVPRQERKEEYNEEFGFHGCPRNFLNQFEPKKKKNAVKKGAEKKFPKRKGEGTSWETICNP